VCSVGDGRLSCLTKAKDVYGSSYIESQSCRASLAVCVTSHPTQVNVPCLNLSRLAGTLFPIAEGWKAALSWLVGFVPT